jgi:hypothetical protein
MAAQLNKRLQQQLNTTYQQMRMIVACGESHFSHQLKFSGIFSLWPAL